jgi:hypothetical protein
MVILALLLPVLIGSMALGIDVAMLYFNWTSIQVAGDASALAGASYLPAFPTVAQTTATSYALLNGLQAGEVSSVTVSPDNMSLTVQLSRNVPYLLARVLGLTSTTVSSSSTAQAVSVGNAQGITPLGIDYRTSYTYGQPVSIKGGQVGAGNWAPLALGGSGASNYLNNIQGGYQGSIAIGDMVTTETGNIVGPTKTGIDARIAAGLSQAASGTFADHALDDPRVMLVPMVDFSGINGKSQVPVKGFAELWVIGVTGSTIDTYFIEQTAPNTQPVRGIESYGAFSPVLIK